MGRYIGCMCVLCVCRGGGGCVCVLCVCVGRKGALCVCVGGKGGCMCALCVCRGGRVHVCVMLCVCGWGGRGCVSVVSVGEVYTFPIQVYHVTHIYTHSTYMYTEHSTSILGYQSH